MAAQQVFGLDIGTSLTKIVEIKGTSERRVLAAAGFVQTSARGGMSESDADLHVVAASIRDLARELKVSTPNVIASLPESQIFTRVIEMPSLTENELRSAIKYEAEQYIPISLSDVKLDYQIISNTTTQSGEKKMEVLLVAAPNILVKRYLSIISMAGLKPYALETEITATARSLVNVNSLSPTTMILDIGATTTKISVVLDHKISFTRSVAIGGAAFTRSIAQSLGFEYDQAEQYKNTYGLDSTQLEGKITAAIKPIFDVVTNELQRAMVYWAGRKPNQNIKRLVITGGSAKLPGIIPYLTSATGLEGQLGDAWDGVVLSDGVTPTVREDNPYYSVAAGLSLKGLLEG